MCVKAINPQRNHYLRGIGGMQEENEGNKIRYGLIREICEGKEGIKRGIFLLHITVTYSLSEGKKWYVRRK